MKQKKINLNMIISLVLALLAVVSLLGYTSSYFTASAKREGTLGFATMKVRFAYYYNDGEGTAYYPQDNQGKQIKDKISLYPANTAAIQRGVAFGVSPDPVGSAVQDLTIHNMNGSCSAYVRFWINAYVIQGDKQLETNYGQYFTLNSSSSDVVTTDEGKAKTETVYCLKKALAASTHISIGSTITMSTSAPDSLMGETLRIDICMDAIQSANVVKSVYDDDPKGYYSGWDFITEN